MQKRKPCFLLTHLLSCELRGLYSALILSAREIFVPKFDVKLSSAHSHNDVPIKTEHWTSDSLPLGPLKSCLTPLSFLFYTSVPIRVQVNAGSMLLIYDHEKATVQVARNDKWCDRKLVQQTLQTIKGPLFAERSRRSMYTALKAQCTQPTQAHTHASTHTNKAFLQSNFNDTCTSRSNSTSQSGKKTTNMKLRVKYNVRIILSGHPWLKYYK